MISREYRVIIARIVFNVMKRDFPGLNKTRLKEMAAEIARNVHARMYGANVDGVDSPIWQDKNHNPPCPQVDATELLNEKESTDI